MKTYKFLSNKSKTIRSLFAALSCILFVFVSCNKNKLHINNNFPFEVNLMPVPDKVSDGQTIEIRLKIEPSASYSGTEYFIRYFQFDGVGTLRYYNDIPYIPNDLYPLPVKQFRLYYTSSSKVSQTFDVWISDNFGNEKKLSFKFDSSD